MIIRRIWEENEKKMPEEKLLISREEAETIALGYVSLDHRNSTINKEALIQWQKVLK